MSTRYWITAMYLISLLVIGLEINVTKEEDVAELKGQACPSPAQLGFKAEGPSIHVPEDFSTIQAAIDAAPENATIRIAPGTYQENLVIRKSLRLQGVSRDHVTIQSAQPSLATILIVEASTLKPHHVVVMENLTIAESGHQEGRIEVVGTIFTVIQYSAFRRATLYTIALAGEDYVGGGVFLCGNLFEHGGVRATPSSSQWVMITDNTFQRAGIHVRYSEWALPPDKSGFSIERVLIQHNIIHDGGIWLYKARGIRIYENSIEGKEGLFGLDIHGSEAVAEKNIIRNKASSGVIVAAQGRAVLKENRIEGNGLHGIDIQGESHVELRGNLIVGNLGWGILTTNTASVAVCQGNQLAQNQEGDYGRDWIGQTPQPSLELKQKCEGG